MRATNVATYVATSAVVIGEFIVSITLAYRACILFMYVLYLKLTIKRIRNNDSIVFATFTGNNAKTVYDITKCIAAFYRNCEYYDQVASAIRLRFWMAKFNFPKEYNIVTTFRVSGEISTIFLNE